MTQIILRIEPHCGCPLCETAAVHSASEPSHDKTDTPMSAFSLQHLRESYERDLAAIAFAAVEEALGL